MMPVPGLVITDIELSLADAIITSSTSPLILLDGNLRVITASASFCEAFEVDPDGVAGLSIFEMGQGEWNVPQFRSLLTLTLMGSSDIGTCDMDLTTANGVPRQLELHVKKLEYGDTTHTRLLLAVSDMTDERLREKRKDELIHEKAVLLQEVQHRVANSLQIIASVLMQSARRVQSEETRTHLKVAHGRVMSIAAVQKQLAVSSQEDVELRRYFKELCQSLGASMIPDPELLSLEVDVDDSTVSPNVSVSLGLIVTELVINAFKHAFPDERSGKIIVEFKSDPGRWHLCVSDNGVGMPANPSAVEPGLGTSIIEAISRQLHATIKISDARPGTSVRIECETDDTPSSRIYIAPKAVTV